MKVAKNLVQSSHKNYIRSAKDLYDNNLIPFDHIQPVQKASETLPIAITPHIAKQINLADSNDPLARQFIPNFRENNVSADEIFDPIGDQAFTPVEGIVHRYPDRVLLIPILSCPIYCRYCFRRAAVGSGTLNNQKLNSAIEYIRQNKKVWEVILSGGDPLILSQRRISTIISKLDEIDHVKVIRIHTRVPVVDPSRISCKLVKTLKCKTPVYVVLHCNHPKELEENARNAIALMVDSGIPLLSQTVLLKGVNDQSDILEKLMRELVICRIKPYYLHHGDKALGTRHFRTSLKTGLSLMKKLRGKISGLCQPTYMIDIPGGYGKVPINSSYVRQTKMGDWCIEDWQGEEHSYKESTDYP